MKHLILTILVSSCAHAGTKTNSGNPASIFCVQKDGMVSIAKDHEGNESGMCNLGRAIIPEWTLYHELNGEKTIALKKFMTSKPTVQKSNPGHSATNPASVNCTQNGGSVEIYSTELGQFGICKFEDKSEIEEWTLFRGRSNPMNAKLTALLITPPTPAQ